MKNIVIILIIAVVIARFISDYSINKSKTKEIKSLTEKVDSLTNRVSKLENDSFIMSIDLNRYDYVVGTLSYECKNEFNYILSHTE